MAGKPDLSVSPQQQQPPGVQNVVVYVSNDNFAQAYAVNQQNVAAFTSQGSATPISQSQQMQMQNGGPASAPMASMAPMAKGLFNKPVVKPMEFPTNALLENVNVNVSVNGSGSFYTSNVITQNGFPYNNLNHLNSVPVLNTNSFDSAVKNVMCGEIVREFASDKTNKDGESYSGFVAVMGAEPAGLQNGVAFPRCDSVRSETAESSCSSLSSSGESQVESSGVVLTAPGPNDLVMYDNGGVSVSVRHGQQLGNLVLTMVPPGPNSAAAVAPAPAPQPPAAVTVPLGWKRIITNNLVIYISPSNTVLGSLDQVKEYLMTQGTCKCGLECPLKHDAVFNFDPKVNSKPYTLSADTSTGDLTKLCNHKRKLLAMATLGGTPPPQPQLAVAAPGKLAPANTVPLDPTKLRKDGGIKRKKRKVGPYSGISVSQLLAQREKLALTQQQQQQQAYLHNKDQPAVQFTQQQQQPGWPGSPMPGNQNINRQFVDGPNQNPVPQQFIRYPNQGSTQVNRVVPGSPMMVGGSMMLPQQSNVSQQQQIHQQLQNQQMIYQQIQNHAGQQQQQQHIIGPNGQLINVQQSQGQVSGPAGQIVNGPVGHMIANNNPGGGIVLQGQNINITGQQQNQQMQQHQQQQRIIGQASGRSIQTNINVIQQSNGNIQHQQEFNQRIQQQQFFGQNIQYQNTVDQNKMVQQQFDISKGIRPNCAPNGNAVFAGYRTEGMSQNTVMVSQNQQMVMMTQGPQKNPSWQQNKSNSPNNISQQNVMSQNQTTMVPIQQNQIQMNQNSNVYERVPPLHHHTPPPPVWNEDANRKKVKMGKMSKKQRPYNMDNHQQRLTPNDQHPPCPNIDVRQIPIENNKPNLINNQFPPNSSGPSFMEDPSGYLAQQTALLNSTISRQTGVNNCTSYICHSPNSSPQNQIPQNINVVSAQHGVPLPSNMITTQMKQQQQQQQVFNNRTNMQNNVVKLQQNSSQQYNNNQIVSQNNLPDSSANNENNSSIQCQGCSSDSPHYHDQNDSRLTFNGKQQIRVYQQSQSRPNSQPSTPNPGQQQEDNPVTSSTYIERHGSQPGYVPSLDSRPIQGGTVSTSNGSPVDQNQSEPSPTPSTPTPIQQRNSDTPLMNTNSNCSNFSISIASPVYSYSNQMPIVSSARDNVQMSQSTNSVMSSNALGQHITTLSNANSNKLEGYCPHPHTTGSPLGIISRISGQSPFSVHSGMITTMASGRTVGHNTITSVLAGRANTSTVSINSPATVPVSSAPQNPFHSQANALITAAAIPSQSMTISVSKSPLEMVQSVVSSIQIPHSQSPVVNANNIQQNQQQISPQQIVKHSPTQGLPPGHILVSSGGQLLMASTGQANGQGMMAPPPPKLVSNASPMPPMSGSPMITNVTASVTQVIPAVGVAQQVLGQQTVLVNALPTPFVIQPGVVTVDGMTVGQNMQIPHLVTGNVIQQQIQIDGNQDPNNRVQHHSPGFANRQPALLSPESNKKKGGKKRKMPSQTVASMLHIASQQNSGMVMQQPQQGFSQQSFQMAHSPQGLTTGPIMQALTIVPGKAGVSPQIVMNGQQQAGAFGTQQLITNSQPGAQINLLQPVNLLNGATGVVQNFPTIQQFIVPNLGGMVMSADGTATLVQDTSNIGMQLQLQNVNGQNVLTPVQGTGNMFNQGQSILAAGPAGMVIRTPGTTQGKIIQQQHSPGAQFLSPNGSQFLMNGAQFNGQLSPLIANVSPGQQVTFSTAPQQVRPNTSMQQQEFIQCNQMGQTLMVPCAPAPTITVTTASSQQNTTFVHQNTTIVQQQTTMVSNNPIQNFTQNQPNPNAQNITESTTTLNVDQNFMINNGQSDNKQQQQQQQQQQHQHQQQQQQQHHQQQMQSLLLQRQSPQNAAMMRHSVSTQTAVNQKLQASAVTTNTFCQTSMTTSAGSPPDTTTHSPLAPGGQSPANADTTTHSIGTCSTDEGLSPSPSNSSMTGSCADIIAIQARQQAASMAMVHCISSSEPDSGDLSGSQELDWSRNGSTNLGYKPEFELSGAHISRKPDTPTMAYVESSTVVSGMHFVADTMKTQESVVSSRHFDKAALKRKHSDTLVVMETRHMHTSLQEDEDESTPESKDSVQFVVGDLVWGPAHGCPSWPGKLVQMVDGAEGKVLVRWFGGDKTPSEMELSALQTLSEGLDAHHRARKKCRKSRKLNSQLEKAIQEAMSELDRMTVDQQTSKPEKHQQQQPKSQIHNKMMATTQTIIKGEIAGRLRSSQR